MALSRITVTGDGSTRQWGIPFALGYIRESDITCRVGDEVDGTGNPVYRPLTFLSPEWVEVGGPAPGNNVRVVFTRSVDREDFLVDYEDGDIMNEENLNLAQKQALMLVHEVLDGRFESFQSDFNLGGFRVSGLGDPIAPQDGATKKYVDERVIFNTEISQIATIAAGQAAASAAGAAASAGAASGSATTAAARAADANNSAIAAAGSANTASTASTQAVNAKTASETARDLSIAAQNHAATSRDTAANAATNAAASAVTASDQRGLAQTARSEANTAKNGAEAARDQALVHQNGAQSFRNEAEGFKNQAAASVASVNAATIVHVTADNFSAAQKTQARLNIGVPDPQTGQRDATVGRALLVGAFGLGAYTYAPNDDVNAIAAPGQYLIKDAGSGGKNAPDGGWWVVNSYSESTTGPAWQEAWRITGGGDVGSVDKRVRRRNYGGWEPWRHAQPLWEKIATDVVSGIGAATYTNLGMYRELRLAFSIIPSSTPTNFGIQFSANNGSTWIQNYRGAGYYVVHKDAPEVTSVTPASTSATTFAELATNACNQQLLIGETIIGGFSTVGRPTMRSKAAYTLKAPSTGVLTRVVYDFSQEVMDGSSLNALRVIGIQDAFGGTLALEGIRA